MYSIVWRFYWNLVKLFLNILRRCRFASPHCLDIKFQSVWNSETSLGLMTMPCPFAPQSTRDASVGGGGSGSQRSHHINRIQRWGMGDEKTFLANQYGRVCLRFPSDISRLIKKVRRYFGTIDSKNAHRWHAMASISLNADSLRINMITRTSDYS